MLVAVGAHLHEHTRHEAQCGLAGTTGRVERMRTRVAALCDALAAIEPASSDDRAPPARTRFEHRVSVLSNTHRHLALAAQRPACGRPAGSRLAGECSAAARAVHAQGSK